MAFSCLYVFLYLSTCAIVVHSACEDIDTNACKLMNVSRPSLCTDPGLSSSACPRFCNLCPLECYDCSTTDFNTCTSVKQCGSGEVCMQKTLRSIVDGHSEYILSCERKEVCDGPGLTFPFGKRDVQSRDISVRCCGTDRCNFPVVSSGNCSTGKDIIVMVDQSSGSSLSNIQGVISFLFHAVAKLDIGLTDNLMALYSYDTTVHEAFGLQDYVTTADLQSALLTFRPSNAFSVNRADTDQAVQFLIQHILATGGDDRSSFDNVVIIIADDRTARTLHVNLSNEVQLQRLSHDVIIVTVGGPITDSGAVATDLNHVIDVQTYTQLGTDTSVLQKALALIKTC